MSKLIEYSHQNFPDVSKFIETIKSSTGFFGENAKIFIARAPGRLDVMGGIADYSGSLVLELPIGEAVMVALQKQQSRSIRLYSSNAEDNARENYFEMSLDDFEKNNSVIEYAEVRERLRGDSRTSWAAYAAGAFAVLMRERGVKFSQGANILIDSKVPEGKGVSSSAAIEVAVMSAIAAAFQIEVNPRELAILCQKVENLVVGAPCGIMDQMTAAAGRANQFLRMICQPAELQMPVSVPDEIAFWGIDSGIRHSVGAGDYGSVRTGAFIGYRIIADLAKLKAREAETSGAFEIEDMKWNGYLANISPVEFEKHYAAHLPKEISGAEFIAKYKGITDRITEVLPKKTYQVFAPTAHPIYENARVQKFAKMLNEPLNELTKIALGRLMYESHESYSACGLGTNGTDFLVELVKNSKALYGAKITGGGSGGTIAVLGERGADRKIERIAGEYEKQTGYRPYVFSGSSSGAAAFGHLELNL